MIEELTICQCCEYLATMINDKELLKTIDYIEERATAMYNKLVERKTQVERLESELRVNKWIPVELKVPSTFNEPDGSVAVLVCREDGFVTRGIFTDNVYGSNWYTEVDHIFGKSKIIAWMPLPEPYKGENKND